MNIPEDRLWMYNRTHPNRGGTRPEYIRGVETFIQYASILYPFKAEGKIRCPCLKCLRKYDYKLPDEVGIDLYRHGFKLDYFYWTDHGEVAPPSDRIATSNTHYVVQESTSEFGASSTQAIECDNHLNRYNEMFFDATRQNVDGGYRSGHEEAPNPEAQTFYDILNELNPPLYDGCNKKSPLSTAAKMISVQSDYNVPHDALDELMQYFSDTSPSGNLFPTNYHEALRLVKKLGLDMKKIDCYVNGCMLYYKADEEATCCKFCGVDRYKIQETKKKGVRRQIPVKRIHYLPLIPILERLYASMNSAQHMTWHSKNQRSDEVMSHPCDGKAWKHFDETFPNFANEPRNVRLALCTDGFTPYNSSAAPYSCWPVIVTPYNLPPEMCMTMPYMFLTCIIPGPKNPKQNIDIYMQPLIDELKELWEVGVCTYDASTKQNFQMRATVMWTISDFPPYGMLSGWGTAGKLACLYCMEEGKATYLRNGRKLSWFDCHRKFLDMDHPYRRNKKNFKRNRIKTDHPPCKWSGHQLWEQVCEFPKVTENPLNPEIQGVGEWHNWKKCSIFWHLPYWKDLLLRHNLDVMHIEKNVFDNIFNTVMDILGKTKDNINAREDIKELFNRPELHLVSNPNGSMGKP